MNRASVCRLHSFGRRVGKRRHLCRRRGLFAFNWLPIMRRNFITRRAPRSHIRHLTFSSRSGGGGGRVRQFSRVRPHTCCSLKIDGRNYSCRRKTEHVNFRRGVATDIFESAALRPVNYCDVPAAAPEAVEFIALGHLRQYGRMRMHRSSLLGSPSVG